MEISINDFNSYQLPLNCFQSHYKVIEYLGEGSFGKVFKAREISTGKIIAVKKMPINHSEKKYSNIIKEINLLKNLDHPNIVKYYDYFEEEDFIYLMMEYLEGGTLKQYINSKSDITEDEARIIIRQLLTALSYLHYTCDICHRDVKPENIMFTNKNDINELKLLDFGLSSDSFESKNYLENCGTLIYMAPEQINNLIYSKAVDVWSVGIILYMLLNKGKNPFYIKGDTQEKIIKNITNNNITFSNDCLISNMGKHLINKLLKKNPSYRYTIRPALEHPWITLNKFDKIPMTIYDKAFIDEYSEKLKTLLLTSIFFSYQKKHNFYVSKNIKKNNKMKIKKNKDKNKNVYIDNENQKDQKSNNLGICLKIFNMNEYEQMVKKSNILYNQKFKEDRELMFNPKLATNYNELLLSTLMKKISEKQRTRQSSFLMETKTNINNNNNNNSIDNTYFREKKYKINIFQNNVKNKGTIIVDEQKNQELDYEQQNLSKLKTPFKFRRNNILEKNRSDVSDSKFKNKLLRRFSAMPKMPRNSLNKMNNDAAKAAFYGKENSITKRMKAHGQNQHSPIKNYIDRSKKENDNKNKNDINAFKNQMNHKKKKSQTKSNKNVNSLFHIERSLLINNKEKKWKMQYNKNNEEFRNFPFLQKKEKTDKNLFDGNNIFLNNEIKESVFFNNDKKNKMLSITEQSPKNQNNQLFNKKLPKLFCDKHKINHF
jgi:serine/threonine protein kinase